MNTTVNSVIEVSKVLMYNRDVGGNLFGSLLKFLFHCRFDL